MLTTEPLELVSTIARYGLAGDDHAPSRPLADGDWAALISACHRQRLIGHLCAMVVEGAFPTTDAQKNEVTAWDLQLIAHKRRLDTLVTHLATTLDVNGIECLVLKGPVLARLAYQPADRRHYFDIDLLVPAAMIDEAVHALATDGFERRSPPLRKGYDARFAKSVTLRGQEIVEVDLHRTLFAGPFGLRVDIAHLWESAATIDIDGCVLSCMSAEDNLVHVCCNAALADVPPRWSVLRDVVQFLTSVRFDTQQFLERVARHQVGFPAAQGILLAADAMAPDLVDDVVEWARGYHPSKSDQRRMRAYRDRRTYTAQTLESLLVLQGVRDRARFAVAAAFPSREFLRSVDATRVEWLQRGHRSLHGSGD